MIYYCIRKKILSETQIVIVLTFSLVFVEIKNLVIENRYDFQVSSKNGSGKMIKNNPC